MERYAEIEQEDLAKGVNLSASHHSNHSSHSSSPSHSSHSSKSSSSHSSHSKSSHNTSKSKSSKSKSSKPKSEEKKSKNDEEIENINLDTLFITDPKPEEAQNQLKDAENYVLSYQNMICNLKINNLLYHAQSNITYTVIKQNTDSRTPSIVIQNKLKEEDKDITVTLDTINEYTVYREIRVVYVNYLNKTKQLLYPVNINMSFEIFHKSFTSTYNCSEETISIIYKEAKVTDLNEFNFSSFDFDNDYLILLEKSSKLTYLISGPTSSSVSSLIMDSYVAFIKQNIQINSVRLEMEEELMSAYLEIYQLNIQFDKVYLNKLKKEKIKLCKKLLKANWRDKASLVYTLPLRQITNRDDHIYSLFQNVTLQEKTIYVLIVHLYLLKSQPFKYQIEDCLIEKKFEIISQNSRFCFNQIEINQLSNLFLNAKD